MRKIVAYEMVTLDGFIGDETDGVGWAVQDPEVMKYSQRGSTGKVEMFMFGRVSYDSLAAFWPTPAGEKANRFYADSLNNTPKIVFSRSLKEPEWRNTTALNKLDEATIDRLKQQGDGTILIFGSGTIVSQLMEMDAIDEYQLLVNPIVLGKGKRLFANVDGMKKLELAETKTFPSGIVLMKYTPAA
jgi:dihydrofolate reductase